MVMEACRGVLSDVIVDVLAEALATVHPLRTPPRNLAHLPALVPQTGSTDRRPGRNTPPSR